MQKQKTILLAAAVSIGVAVLSFQLVRQHEPPAVVTEATTTMLHTSSAVIRLGLVPERDIFAQRARYRTLANHLEQQLDQSIELVTVNTYDAILGEFDEGRIDAAFLGSMVAKVVIERYGAKVLLKPIMPDGTCTYRGVLFVRHDSPVQTVADLVGKTVGYVKTTTAGDLFAAHTLYMAGFHEGGPTATLVPVGTHDEVILAVAEGQLDAGAVKNLRLDAWEEKVSLSMRRLVEGLSVPNNALVVHRDAAETLGPKLTKALLALPTTAEGQAVLRAFGVDRFEPCRADEYRAIDAMADDLEGVWRFPER